MMKLKSYSPKKIIYVLSTLANKIVDLLFPPLCLYCDQPLFERKLLLCPPCLEQLEMVSSQERCPSCYAILYQHFCPRCIQRKTLIRKQVAACELIGPAFSIMQGMKLGNRRCIAVAASLMAYQWLDLEQPMPEILVPLASSFWVKQRAGCDPQLELTKQLSLLLNVPVASVFKEKFDKNKLCNQGEWGTRLTIKRARDQHFSDRKILLIGLRLNDALLRAAGEALNPFFPTQIDALTFGDE